MQTLTHQNLSIEGMVRMHRVIDIQMAVTKNEHAKLFIRGIAMDDDELGDITDQLLSPALGSKFTLYRYEDDKKIPIFSGFIENVNLVEDKGIDYFEVEVISASILFDRKKRKRSFQNVSMTYEELALQIVSEYDAGATICTVGDGESIGTPMIQYNETDWEFLKRIASHFESPIYPEYTHCLPRVWFGFPTQMNMVDISEHNYIYGQDQSYFDIINKDNDLDFRYVETESYDNFEIGSGTNFRNRVYNLYQKYGIMDNGELIFTYRFGSNGLKQSPKFYNDIISGMSLLGEVAKDDKENVYVKLDIDNGGGGTYPYPFRPETGNMMYCMPQIGTKVSLYFPNFDEKNAMVVNCFRTNGEDCTDMSDPSKRAFNTEHGKCMALHSRTMSLSSTSGSSILLDDDNGLMLNSAKSIKFYAEGGLYLNAHRVNFKAPEGEILALKMDAAMEITQSSVSMCSRFDIKGKNGTILTGTVFVHYEPFDDAPMEKGFDVWGLVGNVLAGIAVVALIAAVVFTGGAVLVAAGAIAATTAAAAVTGAVVGGVVAVGITVGIDVWRGEVSSTSEYIFAGASGAITGAVFGGIGATNPFQHLGKIGQLTTMGGLGFGTGESSNIAHQLFIQGVDEIDWGQAAKMGALGGALSIAGYAFAPYLSKLPGMQQLGNSINKMNNFFLKGIVKSANFLQINTSINTSMMNNNLGNINGKTPAGMYADEVQNLPSSKRPNTVSVIRTADGKYIVGRNSEGILDDEMVKLLNKVGMNQFDGQCAEINALAKALNSGADLKNATISIANVRGANSTSGIHGTFKSPCSTCDDILTQLKILINKGY